MRTNKLLLLALFCHFCIIASGQRKDFNYMRQLSAISTDGWYALPLPDDIFVRLSRDFTDLRLYSISKTDTTEVPYIIRIRLDEATNQVLNLPIINRSKKEGRQFFTFQMPPDQSANHLQLDFNENNFNGTVSIEGSHDQQDWFEVINDQRILSIKNDFINYTYTTVQFPASNFRFLKVGINTDVAVTLRNASLSNHVVKAGILNQLPATWRVQHFKNPNKSVATLKLKHYMPVAKVSLDISHDMDFYRTFKMEALRDSTHTSKGWVKLYDPLIQGYVTSFQQNDFEFTYELTNEIKLTLNHQDNPPLTLNNITVFSPHVEIITHLKPGEYILCYGNKNVYKPSYDLELFKEKIPPTLLTASLMAEQNISIQAENLPLLNNKLWIWLALIIVIGALGYFTIRMLNKPVIHP